MATAVGVLEATWEPVQDSEFYLKPLDGKDMLRVSEVVTFDRDKQALINAEACITLLRYGLCGWRSFKDAEGNEPVFGANQDDNLAQIPFNLVRPLAMIIFGKSELGAADSKN